MPRSYSFSFGDVFPATDPVARWLVTMSIGFNDVVLANSKYEQGETDFENLYFFRLASTHLWELAKFITETHDAWEEIQQFVDALPATARDHFEAIREVATTGTVATAGGTELVQVRDLFAHYEEMDAQARKNPRDPITRAMEALVGDEAHVTVSETVRDLRLAYADEVIAKTVMRLIPDAAAQQRVLGALAEGVGHVIQFVQLALNAWLEPRKDRLAPIT